MNTKAPWNYGKPARFKGQHDETAGKIPITAGSEGTIANVFSNEDNAKLIASAPELLEACKEAKKFLNDGDNAFEFKRPYQYRAWKKCEQAIAKAEGK